MTIARARGWHAVTLVIAVAALVLQLGLVIQGQSVLDETQVPPLSTRLWHLAGYFTIQSNVLAAVAAATLARTRTATVRCGGSCGSTRCSASR